jgi:hypothetical protein
MKALSRDRLRQTPVYDVYWYFACERQDIFYKRLLGMPAPWTCDPIIAKHKFTNAYRVLDRVSQYLVSDIINPGIETDLSSEEVVFRILLFKLFNKIETWQLLQREVGGISWAEYSYQDYDRVLSGALARGTAIYSAAYIMASGRTSFGHPRKHQNHLQLIEQMMSHGIGERLGACVSMSQAYNLLLSYPLIGKFLAYQFVTDINYSNVTDFSEEEFVLAGPGARDGIAKCFSNLGGYSDEDVIRWMMDNQEKEFRRLGLSFKDLFGRSLKLIDCQNIFCEVGKYARVSHPRITDNSGRTKIKQVFRTSGDLPVPAFPGKWGLSGAVNEFLSTHSRQDGMLDSGGVLL